MNRFAKVIVAVSLFFVLSFSLLFLSIQQSVTIPYITPFVHSSLDAIHSVLSIPVHYVSAQKDAVLDLMNTYQENKELKVGLAEVDSLKAENASLREELAALQSDLGTVSSNQSTTFLSANVLVRNPASWVNSLTINVGSSSGILEGQLVMANGGLIGMVEKVYDDSAAVSLLTNSDGLKKIAIRIENGDTDVYGILSGYDTDSNRLIVSQLNSSADLTTGNAVVTSDLAGTSPANIQIGKVSEVVTSSGNLNRQVYIEPSADFSTIYSVLVVMS